MYPALLWSTAQIHFSPLKKSGVDVVNNTEHIFFPPPATVEQVSPQSVVVVLSTAFLMERSEGVSPPSASSIMTRHEGLLLLQGCSATGPSTVTATIFVHAVDTLPRRKSERAVEEPQPRAIISVLGCFWYLAIAPETALGGTLLLTFAV